MRKSIKKAISVFLVAVMVFGTAPLAGFVGLELPEINLFSTKAEAVTYNGTCGDNLTWTLDTRTGELVISGTGDMSEWSDSSDVPWKDCSRSPIRSVKIENGVTSIGDYAFEFCSSVENVKIGNSVTDIGDYAFSHCTPTSIDIPDGVTNIGDYAFYCCHTLKSINIPDSVISIGDYAFYRCENLESIDIPDSVISIGDYAFYCCENLESIDISDGVTSIGNNAFDGCIRLETVELGEGVKTIGNNVFSDCKNLISISVDADNTAYSSDENGVLFNKNKTELVLYPAFNPISDYEIPEGVTKISDYAFCNCRNLESVTISESVTNIGCGVFAYSYSLKDIWVDADNPAYSSGGYGVLFNKDKTKLIKYLYQNEYMEYTIPDGVKIIDDYAFSGCDFLYEVTIPDSVTSIGDYAFYDCCCLDSVDIPDGVTNIGDYAFFGCSLTSVDIPDGVTNIGNYVFYGCDFLYEVTIPDSVTSIGDHAFYGCYNLNGVLIPDSVTIIGDYAFAGCGLTSIDIPDSVTSIGEEAFSCCCFTNVVIPESVTSIGDYAFYRCENLTSIDIPDSVTSMGDYAFFECYSLESVTIGKGLTSINSGMFRDCSLLTHISADADNPAYSNDENGVLFNKDKTELLLYPAGKSSASYKIPDGVTIIGDCAFYGCRNLKSVTIPDSVRRIGLSAFCGCGLTSIDIPDGVTSIDVRAFYYCSGLTTITIPASVIDIADEAFRDCSLTGITVDKDNPAYSNDEHGALFNKNKTKLLYYPIFNSETDYVVPDGVTSIGNYVFYFCPNLESITFPESLKEIGEQSIVVYDRTKDIYYEGTKDEWEEIDICSSNNYELSRITIHYKTVILNDSDFILTPSRTVIGYGDSIILHVDASKIPEGGRVEWYPSNSNFDCSVSDDGTTCTITPSKKGDTTFTAMLYDANGNAIFKDEQTMTSKAGFFDKIIAFFKKLFGLTKTIPEVYKGIY